MRKYRYFWDNSLWEIHAKNLEEARQLVFDMDRIPYDMMCIPTININKDVSNEDKENKTTKSKENLAVNL